MTLKTFFISLIFAILALFAVVNWNSFIAPTSLWLIVTTINAPLGLIMLGFIALISLLFLIYIAYLQSARLMESRHFNKDLTSLRELAEKAEASRLTGLHQFLQTELSKMEGKTVASEEALQKRLAQLDHDLHTAVEQAGNTLAAYIGELEDRLTQKRE